MPVLSWLAAAKDWEAKYQKLFKETAWHAAFQGHDNVIPLVRVEQGSKHARDPDQRRKTTHTTLVSYRVDRLIDMLLPNHQRQSEKLKHNRLWRAVQPSFSEGRNLTLSVTDLATGAETELHVGPVAFVRTHSIATGELAKCGASSCMAAACQPASCDPRVALKGPACTRSVLGAAQLLLQALLPPLRSLLTAHC